MSKRLVLVLEDIRSAYNVGAILRSADGAGVDKVYLCGYTPAPAKEGTLYKSKADKMIAKTALGAERSVAWEKQENIHNLVQSLKARGFWVAALEKTEDAVDIMRFTPSFPLALVVGSETEGISEDILGKCDAILSIPMRGKKESLNVSVAAGIAMYQLLR